MEIDLLFTAVKQSEWSKVSADGTIGQDSAATQDEVKLFKGNDAEKIINHYYDGTEPVLLIVLDPLRIQSPIKHVKQEGFEFVAIKGSVTIDAVIDKIKLQADDKGKFSVQIKHFD